MQTLPSSGKSAVSSVSTEQRELTFPDPSSQDTESPGHEPRNAEPKQHIAPSPGLAQVCAEPVPQSLSSVDDGNDNRSPELLGPSTKSKRKREELYLSGGDRGDKLLRRCGDI